MLKIFNWWKRLYFLSVYGYNGGLRPEAKADDGRLMTEDGRQRAESGRLNIYY
jgi:hypothetical protein